MPSATRVGDKSQCPADAHGCPGCPHGVIGPAVSGSPDVFINSKPALRVGDPGIHAACCGPNTWKAIQGSPNVFINGKPAHRLGDADQHCGGIGKMIEGSPNVFINELGMENDNKPVGFAPLSTPACISKEDSPHLPLDGYCIDTGLGDDVNDLVMGSPTLAEQWGKLKNQDERWHIEYVAMEKGEGGYFNPHRKVILINREYQGNPEKSVSVLSHEIGHANHNPRYVGKLGVKKEDWMRLRVEDRLLGEAEAVMNNCKVRDEILVSKGVDIGVAGMKDDTYISIYREYQMGLIDRATALDKISNEYKDERIGKETYYERYMKNAQEEWQDWLDNRE